MGFLTFLFAYFIGGFTLLPILIVSFIYLHPIRNNKNSHESSNIASESPHSGDILDYAPSLKAGEVEELHHSGLDTYKSGWVIVTQEYLETPDDISTTTQSITDNSENKSAYSSLYKLVRKQTVITDPSSEAPPTLTPTTTQQDDIENPKNVPASDKVRSSQRKHRFYAILKHGNLFLYKNESLKDVKHVIVLLTHFISIWPRTLTDAQMFTKSSAVAIMNCSKITTSEISQYDSSNPQVNSPPKGTFFIYCDINSDKEDWYFALVRATKSPNSEIHNTLDPKIHAKTLHFTTSHMINLILTLYSSEGQLQTKWLNALIGRFFLALQNTKILSNYLHTKIAKKLNKIKKPGFLDEFVIKSIYPGDSAPFFTFPSLKEISPDGTIIVSTNVTYTGSLSLEIATKVNISIATFKTREVDLLLRITLTKLQGPVLLKFKPPPSGRMWYTFESEPIMNLKIEPIISSRQMTYNIITNSIEKKFKEAIKESLVLPHWDDIVFYDTSGEIYRAGVWDPEPSSMNSEPATPHEEETESFVSEDVEIGDPSANLTSRPTSSRLSTSKLTNTISDLSNRMKKARNEQFFESSSSFEEHGEQLPTSKNSTINTLKKIGKWYFKDDKGTPEEESYSPPEMISNRRIPRKGSNASTLNHPTSPIKTSGNHPSYAFAKDSIFKSEDMLGSSLDDKNGASIHTGEGSIITESSSIYTHDGTSIQHEPSLKEGSLNGSLKEALNGSLKEALNGSLKEPSLNGSVQGAASIHTQESKPKEPVSLIDLESDSSDGLNEGIYDSSIPNISQSALPSVTPINATTSTSPNHNSLDQHHLYRKPTPGPPPPLPPREESIFTMDN